MPLITLRLRAGLTPRRWVGISGSIAAHCSSFSQYSFAIHLTPAKLGSLNRNQPSRGKSYWFNWVLSLEQVGLKEGAQVEVLVEGSHLVIRCKRLKLMDLLAQCRPENRPDPIDFGPPVGREII